MNLYQFINNIYKNIRNDNIFLLSTIPNITAMYKNFFHIYLNITYIHISIRPIFSVKSEQNDFSHFSVTREREKHGYVNKWQFWL